MNKIFSEVLHLPDSHNNFKQVGCKGSNMERNQDTIEKGIKRP